MNKQWPAMVAALTTLVFAERADAQRCGVGQQPTANCQTEVCQARGSFCTAPHARPGAAAKSAPAPAAQPPRTQAARARVRGNGRQGFGGPGRQGGACAPSTVDVTPRSCVTATTPALAPATVALLQGTLADEFYARDFYSAAAKRFSDRRFANLARAEQNHVDALSRLVRMANAEPVVDAGRAVELPDDLAQVQERAEEIERQMIAAYDVLLALDTNPPARTTFEHIQAANRRHLLAAGR